MSPTSKFAIPTWASPRLAKRKVTDPQAEKRAAVKKPRKPVKAPKNVADATKNAGPTLSRALHPDPQSSALQGYPPED
uniref:Uncharacterized protein n=1 Tax=Arundo donax TaxID=35708 RepID=A0A0A9FPU6_ARUDO